MFVVVAVVVEDVVIVDGLLSVDGKVVAVVLDVDPTLIGFDSTTKLVGSAAVVTTLCNF